MTDNLLLEKVERKSWSAQEKSVWLLFLRQVWILNEQDGREEAKFLDPPPRCRWLRAQSVKLADQTKGGVLVLQNKSHPSTLRFYYDALIKNPPP